MKYLIRGVVYTFVGLWLIALTIAASDMYRFHQNNLDAHDQYFWGNIVPIRSTVRRLCEAESKRDPTFVCWPHSN